MCVCVSHKLFDLCSLNKINISHLAQFAVLLPHIFGDEQFERIGLLDVQHHHIENRCCQVQTET